MLPFAFVACVLVFLLVVAVAAAAGLVLYARWNYGTLEKRGIPVVPPSHFLLGSALLTYQRPGGLVDIDHFKKYGSVFGLYEGREPQIFICDPELVRNVTTKYSDHFDDKRRLEFGDPLFDELLYFQPRDKWRLMRSLISPYFSSSARLRENNEVMTSAIQDFLKDVKSKMGDTGRLEKFCIKSAIFSMLADLFARTMYSVDLNKSEMSQKFVQILRELLEPPANQSAWIATYSYAFPFIKKYLPNTLINPEPPKQFCFLIKQMMRLRKEERSEGTGPAHQDYLDHLIKWYDQLGSEEFKRNGITQNTIFNLGIFIGGYYQISLILSAMLYHVAKDKEVERKLQAEVDLVFERCNGKLDHESLSDLPYLTACVTEAARLYPFFFRSERVCTKDWKDEENGMEFRKGDVVQIPIWAIHRNPKYFEDAEKFMPERFLPGNRDKVHPYSFASFGFGPRICVARKVSMEIMTLLGAHLIRELKFYGRGEDTELKFLAAGPFFGASGPVYLDVEERRRGSSKKLRPSGSN